VINGNAKERQNKRGVDLAEGEIALRRGDYKTAQKYAQTSTPAFAKPDAEAYQKRAPQNLSVEIDKHLPQK